MRCHTQMLPSTVPWALALLCRHESAPDVNVVATVVLVLGKDPDQWQAVQRHPSSQEQAVRYEAEIPGTDSTIILQASLGELMMGIWATWYSSG